MVRHDPSAALAEHYRPLATLIARLVAREVSALRAEPRFYTQYDAPLKKRVYLAAARRRAFPSYRIGKTVFALRAEVHAYIERSASARASFASKGEVPTGDEIEQLLDAAGLVRRTKPRGTRR